MKLMLVEPIAQFKKVIILLLIVICSSLTVNAQNGTYQKKDANGAYCVISFQRSGNRVKADIFSWWNTASAQTGSYNGEGTLKNNTVLLNSELNEPGCKVVLTVVNDKIKASFANCSTDHLPTDFSGLYTKFTDAVAGDYQVTVPKAYFYKTADSGSKQKAYVLKGDKVVLDIDRIAACKQNWVYVYFTNKAGKDTSGYMLLSDLKKLN
ncbi:hypothetical protein [Mucilaginibacter polytrichastri]|uniref:SH3b domain-containing protein n=1 Tax=Mucilaginibacter polytrichastri TaxID=1302689 RepID=A0A1Q6A0B7_9SPHI|nr:hypothetical protein [Mucilaginibacter polytrichastri]OKS87446.1 hypothetical protein RG47T_2907 [Mucilaginibacter polytrichastri]SFS90746.1 hypothetical protein SAMN04487890_10642 [Mucilaginibacter polytrichastri]